MITIGIGFDGTVVKDRFPDIGEDIGAAVVLRVLQMNRIQFILLTTRFCTPGRNLLKEAVQWFHKYHISLIGVNCNPWQQVYTQSPIVDVDFIIDVKAIGTPTKVDPETHKRYVDWVAVVDNLFTAGLLKDEQAVYLHDLLNSKQNG